MSLKKNLLLSGLTGVLLALSFPPFPLHFLVWLAPFPLLISLIRTSLRFAFLQGLFAGFIFFVSLFYWFLSLTPWASYFAYLAWLGVSLVQALFIAFFALGVALFYRYFPSFARLFLIPTLWSALEFLRAQGPYGFSWGALGYSLYPNLVILQLSKITGVFGISFLIVLFGSLLAEFASIHFLEWKKLFWQISAVFAVFLIVCGWGAFILASESKDTKRFKVTIVQGNIAQEEKWDITKEEDIEEVYLNLTKEAVKDKPYLIIWPETATPIPIYEEKSYLAQLRKTVVAGRSYLLLGSFYFDSRGGPAKGAGRQYNSAFLFNQKGKVAGRYDKLKLVPFGEYVPRFYPFLKIKEILELGQDVQPGRRRALLKTSESGIGILICFESDSSYLARRAVYEGADILVVLTNDAWFGRTQAAYEHLVITAFRAVENGVYTLQAANTGISAVVDPYGRILTQSSLFKRGVLKSSIGFKRSKKTFYAGFGDVFSYLCLALSFGAFLFLASEKFLKK